MCNTACHTVVLLPRCMECRRGLTMRFLSVRPSVCPSVRQTRALWQNGRKLNLDFYIIRKNIYLSFLRRRIVGGGDPFYLKFWVNLSVRQTRWSEIADFESIIARSASAVIPSKKSSNNTKRKSLTRFLISLKWSSYVSPKSHKGGSKRKTVSFL